MFGMNYDSVINGGQVYRILTSALTHGPIFHILFNTCAMVVFGMQFEKYVGTLFYAALNMWLLILATVIHLTYVHAMVYWLPEQFGGK